MSPVVTIIVVSYNTREITRECLESVYAQTVRTPFELLVVDNLSPDGSAEMIAEKFPQATLILPGVNLGFARANNLASERARGEFILLLNPDTIVLDGAIDRVVEFARASEASSPTGTRGIWGGRTLFGDRSLNPTSCWRRPTLWSSWAGALGLGAAMPTSPLCNPEAMPGWDRSTERDVDIVSGCFFLIRRDLWQRLKGFDPAFFMYAEEADLCLRARRLGIVPRITPTATIVHYGAASDTMRADKVVRLFTAKALLMRRNWSAPAAWLGARAFDVFALARAVGYRALSLAKPARRADADNWAKVFRARGAWARGEFAGAPPAQPAPAAPAAPAAMETTA